MATTDARHQHSTQVPVREPQADPGPSGLNREEETSLIDILQARERGVDLRQTAAFFRKSLSHFESIGHNLYRRTLLEPNDAEALVNWPREEVERRMIILASNNYLGLTTHPKVVEAARDAALQYGTGSGSSPLLVGTFPVTMELERKLAAFKRTEEACVFATGYSANVGVISSITTRHDVIILDRLAHASMVDGAKLSGAQVKVFRHNDAEHLDRVLKRNSEARLKLVCVEGIYGMDGDIAPLDKLAEVAKRHDAMILVDEAHSTGVLGPEGRGAVAHFALEGIVDLQVGTLSKALGACGGFVAGTADIVTHIRYFARSGMFSTAQSPMVTAAASAAVDVILDEPQLREKLWHNCHFMFNELKRLGFTIGEAPSPVIPVIVGTMAGLRQMTLELHHNNVCVNSIPFPAVPHGTERLRISLTANHNQEQLEQALVCLERAGKNAGII